MRAAELSLSHSHFPTPPGADSAPRHLLIGDKLLVLCIFRLQSRRQLWRVNPYGDGVRPRYKSRRGTRTCPLSGARPPLFIKMRKSHVFQPVSGFGAHYAGKKLEIDAAERARWTDPCMFTKFRRRLVVSPVWSRGLFFVLETKPEPITNIHTHTTWANIKRAPFQGREKWSLPLFSFSISPINYK